MMENNLPKIITLFVIVTLILCTLDMPYGYYQFTRLTCTIAFSFLSYRSSQEKKYFSLLFYATLVILFQPIIPVSFKKEVWNIIDLFIAAILFFKIMFDKNQR